RPGATGSIARHDCHEASAPGYRMIGFNSDSTVSRAGARRPVATAPWTNEVHPSSCSWSAVGHKIETPMLRCHPGMLTLLLGLIAPTAGSCTSPASEGETPADPAQVSAAPPAAVDVVPGLEVLLRD